MNFENDVKMLQYVYGYAMVELGSICTIDRGERFQKTETKKRGKYPVYGGSLNPMGFLDRYNFDGDKVLIVCKGNAGDVGYSNEKFFATDACFVLTPSELVISRYLYHYLCANIAEVKRKVYGVIPGLKRGDLEKIPIAIPPVEKQWEIVKKLDELKKSIDIMSDSTVLKPSFRKFYI